MERRRGWTALTILAGAAGLGGAVTCAGPGDGETYGQAGQYVISAPTTNGTPTISGTTAYVGRHEVAVAFATGNPPNVTPAWAVGWNTQALSGTQYIGAGWAYSSDATGSSFTPHEQTTLNELGNPGTCPDGGTWNGWYSDPTIAPVTDTTLAPSHNQFMYAMVGASSLNSRGGVVVALSQDAGHTWGNAGWADDGGDAGAVDNPWLSTNPVSPWHTFVAWTGAGASFLQRIHFDATHVLKLDGAKKTIPRPPGGLLSVDHPQISVGQYTTCANTVHEAVFVAYATAFDRCGFGKPSHGDNSWWLALYDPTDDVFWGPWELDEDSDWQNCVGGTASAPNYLIDNDPRPRITTDTLSSAFWVAHTHGYHADGTHYYGQRISVQGGTMGCSGGNTTPSFSTWTDAVCTNETGCLANHLGRNDAMGHAIVEDEWGPAIAFTYKPATPNVARIVVTWQSTRDDPGLNNVRANTYMAYAEAVGLPSSTPTRISVGTTGTLPWDQTLGDWSDYQGLAPNPSSGTFLAVWGGDCRNWTMTNPHCGIFSGLLQ